LDSQRARYEELLSRREKSLSALQVDRERAQRRAFLDAHRIDRAQISGIGPWRVAALQSHGIETAEDVSASAIDRVPGFGPAYTQRLLDWRRSVEKRFVFDPNRAIDPTLIAAIDAEIANEGRQLEQMLTAGPERLRTIAKQIADTQARLMPALTKAVWEIAQADADLRVFRVF
jgi:DNA-binding helix-hairpin-helix protein with protein kinase domain